MKKLILFIILSFTSVLIVNAAPCYHITGDGTKIGDEIACGTEHFYVVSNDGENIKMMSKYNLLVGTDYYRVDFDEPYQNYTDIYSNEKIKEQIKKGYVILNDFSEYNPETDKEEIIGILLSRSRNKINGTGIIFETPLTYKEVFENETFLEYLEKGYTYQLISKSSKYYGVYLYQEKDTEYKTILLDNYIKNLSNVLNSTPIKKELDNGYKYQRCSKDSNGYFACQLSKKKGYEYKTIVYNEEYPSDVIKAKDEVDELLKEGYTIANNIYGSSNYIGLSLVKEEGIEYKTIYFNNNYSETYTSQGIYLIPEVRNMLENGYILVDRAYKSKNGISYNSKYSYYRATFSKSSDYEYYNHIIESGTPRISELTEYINNNSTIQNKIKNGYFFRTYSYSEYSRNEPAVISMRRYIGEEKFEEIYQDETALGAHDGEAGKPSPEEIGVVKDEASFGEFRDNETYYEGFRDYEYLPEYDFYENTIPVYQYLQDYKKTLNSNGYKITNINTITVGEINEIVKNITGKEIPLEEWYEEGVGWSEDPVTGDELYILGSIKELLPEEYSWLWGTTYWTRTVEPSFSKIYFIDTLGDLCAVNYCWTTIGAGIRPVVTIAASDVVFKIYTKTDGNGTVKTDYVEAAEGTVVKFTIEPKEGYVLGVVKVTDANGNVVIFTDYTFTMPNANVLIEATFIPENPDTSDIAIIFCLITIVIAGYIIIYNYRKQLD